VRGHSGVGGLLVPDRQPVDPRRRADVVIDKTEIHIEDIP
jgi:hypothetical protein